MKKLFAILLIFGFSVSKSQNISINDARMAFDGVVEKEESGRLFLLKAQQEQVVNQPLFMGYMGAIKATLAKHYINPWTKLSSFNEGRDLLEKAIKLDTQNVELFFLRYMIQTNAPRFLGYYQHISSDKQRLLSALPLIKDKTLQSKIVQYLRENGSLTKSERAKLQETL